MLVYATFGTLLNLQMNFQQDTFLAELGYHAYQTIRCSTPGWIFKQLLHEENKKWGKAMQQPRISYVCGINFRSESSLVLSYLLFA